MTNNTDVRRLTLEEYYSKYIIPSSTSSPWREFMCRFKNLSRELTVILIEAKRVEKTVENPDGITPIETEVGSLGWAEIVTFIRWEDFGYFIVARPDGSAYVHLRYGCCSKVGLKCVIRWMKAAYIEGERELLPGNITDTTVYTLADYCAIERALLFLGNCEGEKIRSIIREYLQTEVNIAELIKAWKELHKDSMWARMIADHVGWRLLDAKNNILKRGHCMCGWKQVSKYKYHQCIPTWVYEDEALKRMIGSGTFSLAECAAMYPRFAMHCKPTTEKRVKSWVMEVDDHPALPHGTLPSDEDLVGPVQGGLSTIYQRHPIQGAVAFEFVDRPPPFDSTDLGYYIETTQSEPWEGRRRTTHVGEHWAARRGLSEGSGDVPSSETASTDTSSGIERLGVPGDHGLPNEHLTFAINWVET